MKVCPTCNRLYQTGIAVCPQDGGLLSTLREWQAGDTVSGKFSIVEKIGHGSLGPAFRANVLPLGGTRVLKCLSLQLANDEDLINHFQWEIQVASAFRHLNAIHLESLERSQDGRPFIVMEYVSGMSLRELLSRGGYMSALDVVDIMAQVCAALDSGHWQGIVHRNLKPDNVIIAEEHGGAPQVKVLELGIASLRQAAAERGKQVGDVVVTDKSIVVGSMEYMSPEQASGAPARMVDGRSDLYSVGVMMFEALTGELPIATEDPMGLLRQKRGIAANDLLCTTILKALHPDPNSRFQAATDMIAALREVSRSLGRPHPEVVPPATGWKAARVAVPNQPASRSLENAPGKPAAVAPPSHTNPPPQRAAVYSKPSSANAVLNDESTTTDRRINEIREAWLRRAGPTSTGRQGWSKPLRTVLLIGVCAVIVLPASWVVLRDRASMTTSKATTTGPANLASPQPLARPASKDPIAQETPAIPVESAPVKQEPAVMQQSPDLPLPLPTGDANASPAPRVAGGQSNRQYAPSATAVTPGNRRSESPGETAGGTVPRSREAEVQKRMAAGWLHVERGRHQAAIESFTEALKLDPGNFEAQAALRLARFATQNPGVNLLPSPPPKGGNHSKEGGP